MNLLTDKNVYVGRLNPTGNCKKEIYYCLCVLFSNGDWPPQIILGRGVFKLPEMRFD